MTSKTSKQLTKWIKKLNASLPIQKWKHWVNLPIFNAHMYNYKFWRIYTKQTCFDQNIQRKKVLRAFHNSQLDSTFTRNTISFQFLIALYLKDFWVFVWLYGVPMSVLKFLAEWLWTEQFVTKYLLKNYYF